VTADLSQARVERGEVVLVERIGDLIEITARLPHLAATSAPGQFAQLRTGEAAVPLLRRPFSVAWTDGELCSFVFAEVGIGTRRLATLHPGDVLDALGPLGSGFSLVSAGPVLCLSGGVGCAPFPLLIKTLAAQGVVDITVLNGAASGARLYPADRFRRGNSSVRVIEATDDGSLGHRGFVTELVTASLTPAPAAVFACGPNIMLAALSPLLASQVISENAVVEASLEAPMGCGFGTCLGCALPRRTADAEPAWALCCTDGPVMPMRDVDWRALQDLPGADVA
jgi:dihydroorotate dehydrogenase electron transfer subunit